MFSETQEGTSSLALPKWRAYQLINSTQTLQGKSLTQFHNTKAITAIKHEGLIFQSGPREKKDPLENLLITAQ